MSGSVTAVRSNSVKGTSAANSLVKRNKDVPRLQVVKSLDKLKAWQGQESMPSVATTSQEETRAAAERVLAEGEQLVKQGTAESLRQAIEKYEDALRLWRAVGDRSKVAVILNNIGSVYDALGDKQKALDYYNVALPLLQAVGNRSGEATTLNNIGSVYNALGDKQKALDYYNMALPLLQAVGNRSGEATTLSNIGNVYADLGENQQALDYLNQALPLQQAVGNKVGEANTLFNLAAFERNRSHLNSALTQIEAAIKIIEQLRTKIVAQELRTSYFASVQNYYKLKIDILMQLHRQQPSKGYNSLALQTSESARARSLLDLLHEANADIRSGVEPKLLEQEQSLQQQLDALEKRRIQALSSNLTPEQQQSLVARFEQEYAALTAQYQQVETQIRATSPRYAALTQPLPLSLAQMQQQVLDENSLLLEYSLGSEHSYLWAVTKTGMTSYELPQGKDIEQAATQLRKQLTKQGSLGFFKLDLDRANTQLSQMLLAPVASQLGHKRLIIVSDGALQYIPFATLPIPVSAPTPRQPTPNSSPVPLLVEHEIVNLPSASILAELRHDLNHRQNAPKTVAVLADAVYNRNDPRLKGVTDIAPASNPSLNQQLAQRGADDTGIKFERLEFAQEEANQILRLVVTNQSEAESGFAANLAHLQKVRNEEIDGYICAHCIAELYAVLTGRTSPRIIPADVQNIMNTDLPKFQVVDLDGSDYLTVIDRMVILGLSSKVIYDALHAYAAHKIEADAIFTLNPNDFNRLGLDVSEKVVVP